MAVEQSSCTSTGARENSHARKLGGPGASIELGSRRPDRTGLVRDQQVANVEIAPGIKDGEPNGPATPSTKGRRVLSSTRTPSSTSPCQDSGLGPDHWTEVRTKCPIETSFVRSEFRKEREFFGFGLVLGRCS
jgi:hypothetical protein